MAGDLQGDGGWYGQPMLPWAMGDEQCVEERQEVCEFWPDHGGNTGKAEYVKVNPLVGWPEDWTDEKRYLTEQKGWKIPEVLGGVTSKGKAKPDFMMYYDVGEVEAPLNQWAENIAALVPEFEHRKVPSPPQGYRGTCILVYSPMISGGKATSDIGAKFSLEELRDVIHFHSTQEAREMYKSHDNPIHRVFGGM